MPPTFIQISYRKQQKQWKHDTQIYQIEYLPIVEQEQKGNERARYGDYLITNLSRYLGEMLGKGFSVANLWNFRQFYQIFPEEEKLYTLCRGFSWSHTRLIMRLDDSLRVGNGKYPVYGANEEKSRKKGR